MVLSLRFFIFAIDEWLGVKQFLIDILRKYSFVKEHTECHMYIDHAKNFQLLPAHRHDSSSPVTSYRTTSPFEDILVVISGGESPRPPYIRSKNVLAFGFNSRKWFRLAALPYDPGIEFATCVHNNDIFVTGGGLYKACFLRYRSKKDKWSQSRAKLKSGRRRHAMAACGNKIYVIGGYNSELEQGNKVQSSIEEFELGCSEWVEVGFILLLLTFYCKTYVFQICQNLILIFFSNSVMHY